MRAMGLDFGTKTVGVAIADELGITAQGVTTVRRTNLKTDVAQLKALVGARGVTRIILGLPLNMDGSEGPRAEASRTFAQTLERELALPVELWDERLTTVAAQRTLLEADVSRAKRKQVVDQLAAVLILQGWLDSQRGPNDYGDDEES
ncbi:MAG: Holliday junction resolvase RuvX [Myxococcaceae bacterium]